MSPKPEDEPAAQPSLSRWRRWRNRRKIPTATEVRERRQRRRRRRLRIFAVVLVLLAVGAGVIYVKAPAMIQARLEDQLARSWGAAVEVDGVVVHWATMGIEAYGVRFSDDVRLEVEIGHVEVDLSWERLIWGPRRATVIVHEPDITFYARPAPPREQRDQSVDKFEAIEIIDGTLRLIVDTSEGPATVELTQIEARIENREGVSPTAKMDLGLQATATIGGTGHLHVEGRTSSEAPAEAWSVRFELAKFPLETLNRLWLDIVEMDVEHGYLGLDGDLTRTSTSMRGRVRPQFSEVSLLGADEDALHPMAEALFGHMLMGANSTISIDRPMTGDRRSSLPELLETDWQTLIQNVIKTGYSRRLSKLRGFTASIGDVRVDFSKGLLQLFDVVVDAREPVIDTPLVAIERVDVVFDPTVTQEGAAAYKHIVLWRPTLTFATGIEDSDNQLQFDESWVDTISAIPFATRDLVVHEGRLEVWNLSGEEPVNVYVSDIEVEGREMARDLHAAGVRGATLEGSGTVLDESRASIRIVYEPKPEQPNLDIDMRLEPILLTTLAPTLEAFAGVGATGGSIGMSAHISARDRKIQASVFPDVHRPKLQAMAGLRFRKLILERALRHFKSHVIELRYAQGPNEGILHKFFPALIKSVFFGRSSSGASNRRGRRRNADG